MLQQERFQYNILAPAGSVEQLVAAVNNGCNAVYLGLDAFNARMKAPNFTRENFVRWTDYCHLFDVKVFVAINTSIKNDEFDKAVELLLWVYKNKADGVILTDLALMRVAASLPKPFEIVASTQLNVHDKYGAEFVKKCGATSVVCARECSLKDIEDIASAGIGVECFLHGAMCVCQSGQCLFSSMVGGNSGNRGLCAQPCRKYYKCENVPSKSGYLLSARDMCGLEDAERLYKAGASTFKIEGRNRRAEYAAVTSNVYSNLFSNGFTVRKGDFDLLAEVFNRAMSSNRYLAEKNDEIVYPAAQNHTGVFAGIIKNGKIESQIYLNKGDGLKVFDNGREVGGGVVLENGLNVRAQFGDKIRDGMTAHRTTSVRICADALSSKRKLNVSVLFEAKTGKRAVVNACCNGVKASVESEFIVQPAQNSPISRDDIVKQLQKTLETHYTIADIDINIDNIFITKAQLNALRRAVLSELTNELIRAYDIEFDTRNLDLTAREVTEKLCVHVKNNPDKTKPLCAVVCYDETQLSKAYDYARYLIYKPSETDVKAFEIASKYRAYVDLPSFANLAYLRKLLNETDVNACLVCHNVGQVELARERKLNYIAGSGLNVFNDWLSAEFDDAETFVYSTELSLTEIDAFKNKRGIMFVDGKITLMKLCHCPFKLIYECRCSTCKADKDLIYKDEMGNRFMIKRRRSGNCSFELINGKKLSVVGRLKNTGRFMLDFDEQVLRHYVNLNNGINDGYVEHAPYTKGRLFDKIN